MVAEWLKDGSIASIPTLIQIVGVYSESELQTELPGDFFDNLQLYVLKSAGTLNYKQAIDLAAIMFPYASSELMEIFDRLIGAHHANLSPFEAFDALMAFSSAKAIVRPKIIQVLFKKLSQNFERLSTQQIVLLVDLVCADADRDLLEKLELNKFLQGRLQSLSVSELVTCYIALSRQNDTALHKAVEEQILSNIHIFRVGALADLLYHQAKSRVANKKVVEAVLQTLET